MIDPVLLRYLRLVQHYDQLRRPQTKFISIEEVREIQNFEAKKPKVRRVRNTQPKNSVCNKRPINSAEEMAIRLRKIAELEAREVRLTDQQLYSDDYPIWAFKLKEIVEFYGKPPTFQTQNEIKMYLQKDRQQLFFRVTRDLTGWYNCTYDKKLKFLDNEIVRILKLAPDQNFVQEMVLRLIEIHQMKLKSKAVKTEIGKWRNQLVLYFKKTGSDLTSAINYYTKSSYKLLSEDGLSGALIDVINDISTLKQEYKLQLKKQRNFVEVARYSI